MAPTVPLTEFLRQRTDAAIGSVEHAIFGTTEPDVIVAQVTRLAEDELGAAVVGGLFYAASSGCVVGLALASGACAVLKAYQPRWELAFLRGVQRVQRAVVARGFPGPAPLAGPTPIGHGLATVESYLPDPGQVRPTDDPGLEQSSAALVRLTLAARDLPTDGLESHPFRIAEGEVYPTPHSPIFDLAGTTSGSEWIDEWASRAWASRNVGSGEPVIGYLDWSARNVRWDEGGLLAVYDWDSLSLASEAVIAGQAAATWRSTGETADRVAPDAAEIKQFIAAFGAARGVPFSPTDLRAAQAAAVWVMAYTARCEHALQVRTPWRRNRARDWLRSEAAALL